MTDEPRTQADYAALIPGSPEALEEADRLMGVATEYDPVLQKGSVATCHTEAARLRGPDPLDPTD
jgi:hypothetical protein